MNYQIQIKNTDGDLRVERDISREDLELIKPGDEVFLLDEAGKPAKAKLTPQGQDLHVEFEGGEMLVLEEYFSSAGLGAPAFLNLSAESDASALQHLFALNGDNPAIGTLNPGSGLAPGDLTSTSGTSESGSSDPSGSGPTTGGASGVEGGTVGGGVGNLPEGDDYSLMRLSNLGYSNFEETFQSYSDELSLDLSPDETPPPSNLGATTPEDPILEAQRLAQEAQVEPEVEPAPVEVIPTVTPPVIANRPPDAVDDVSTTIDEDGSAVISLIGNDTDPDGDSLTITSASSPNGTVTITGGSVVYTPNGNFNGTDIITYTIADGNGGTDTATATVTVSAVNDLPTATDDSYTIDEDHVLTSVLNTDDILLNDSDVDGDTLTLNTTPVTNVSNGTLVLSADGTFTYTPNADFNGTDSFVYEISDGNGGTAQATAVITVNPVNDPPVAGDDAVTTDEDTPVNVPVLINDSDVDLDPLTVTTATAPNGTVVIEPDGTLTYTPDPNFNGSDVITYQISDGNGGSDTATVAVTITPVDDLPVAVDDTLMVDEDAVLSDTLATNDTPSGDGGNVWAKASDPTNGTVVVNTDGTYTYTPTGDYNGVDSFTYTITDADGDVSTATANITVNPTDDTPVAVDDVATLNEDTPLTSDLSPNDTSPDGALTFAKTTDPTNGTVVVNPDGTYTYTPNANYNGPDSFTYTITDPDGDTSTATVNLTVDPVDDLPIAVDDTPTLDEDTVLNDTLVTNDTLSGDGGNVWAKATDPTNGTVVVNADGTYAYTPNAHYNGADSFTYTITDVDGDVSTATVNLTVAPVDDNPVAVDDTETVNEDTPLSSTVAPNDESPDGALTFAKATDPTNGTLTFNPDGTYTYTPTADYNGPDSFTYTITDPDGDTSTATVNITVDPVDDLPVAVDDSPTVNEDEVLSDTLVTNDTPSGDGGNVWAKGTDPANGTVVVNPDGTYVYTPNADYNGPDSFTYTITDVDGDVSTATVDITVDPVDDLPIAVDDTPTLDEDTVLNDTLVTNDTPSGDGGNVWAKATDPTNGTVVVNADGTYSYTPNAHYNGPDSFTYTITDVDGDVSTATVNLTVSPVDDNPVAVDDTETVNEDTPLTSTVAPNDTSPDGALTFAKTTDPTNGTLVFNPDGTYTYTPTADYNGPDSFTYTITDPDGDTSVATVNITVDPVDDVPVAVDDSPTVTEDAVLNDTLVTNDTPSPDGGNVWAKATDPTNGTVVVNADGTYTYTPNADYNGADSFTYTITDVDGDVSTATVNITVDPADDAPVAVDDTETVDEDTPLVSTVAPNDTSPDGALTFAKTTDPTNGTLVFNPDGTYTYTPTANYNGPDSFTYTITDPDGDTAVATVNITVDPVDDVPVAVDDTATVNEDVVLNDTLVTNDTLSGDGGNVWAKATDPSNGTVVVNADGTYTYTPNANYNGADSFTYTITDVDGDVSTATVNLTVDPVDDLPVAVDDTPTVNEDAVLNDTLVTNDTPSGDGGNVWAKATDPSNGTVVVNADGTYTYTPTANYNGADSFTYTITDVDGDVSTATVNLTVDPVDDLPVAVDDTPTVNEDVVLNDTLVTNDTPSGDGGNVWAKATDPTNGTVVVNADGTYSYTPNASYNGPDSFTYTITDVDGDVSTATVSLTVAPVDDVPIAVDDSPTVTEDAVLNDTLVTNDTPSPDGGNVWAKATDPSNGTVVVNADGTYTYTPNADYNGADSFTYTITDVDGDVSTATVNITVDPVDDVPVAVDDTETVNEDTPLVSTVAPNDTSPDGALTFAKTTDPTNGTLVFNPDGTYTYTPTANYNGPDSFTYTITDPDGDTSTATVNITVDPVDDLPVAVDDTATVNEDVVLNDTLVTNDTLSGDGGNVWAKATDPSNGTVVVNADGTYTYTPNANYNGADSFTYTITDVDGDVSTATVNLTVDPVDDLPIAVDDTPTVNEDAVLNDTLVTNDTPSGDGGNVWAKATDPSNGTVVVNADGTYTYTPTANYNGPDSFTYTITDVDGDVSTATATITVSPVDDLPIAVDDTATVNEDVVLNDTLVTNDTPSGDGGNVWAKATDPTNGTVVVNADGTYSYTPNASYNGPDSFTYTITDVDGDVSTATVNLTVAPVDDVPVAVDDSPTVTEDAVLNDTLVTNDTPSPDGGNVWAKATDPSNGTVVVNADGTYTYTPNADYNGADSFTYTITDVDGDVSTATVNITVDPADDAPVAVDDTETVNEDTPLMSTVAPNDTSPDGALTFAKATDPTNGTLVFNPDGTYTYTPTANYNGPDSFTYTITDPDGDTSTATVNITVDPVDDLPVAVDDTATVNEDVVLNDTLVTNDTLSGDGGNVWAKATDPSNGTVVVNADGTYTYTPNANYNGADSFTYTITDVDGDVSTATVNLTVDPVDDLPIAVDDTPTVNEDAVLNDTLVTNDTPSGDGGNVWAKATDPSNGTVVVNADGTYTYTPNANYNGPDSFTYTITDVDGDVSTAMAIITVSPVDDLPIAVDDTAMVNEDVVLNDTLVTNDTPSGDGGNVWAKATDPTNGTVVVNADGTYSYTPNASYNGPDSFTYTMTDVDGDVSTATVNLTVAPVDDVPVAVDDSPTVTEDAVLNDTLVTNDTPSPDGGNVWAKATDPSNGTVVVNADGTYTYTPNADYNGADSFTYTITDVDGDVSTATVNITVDPVDDVPVAVDDTETVNEDTPLVSTVAPNDTSPDGALTFAKTTDPTNGTLVFNPDGTYTYTPTANYNGPDSFTYTITDPDGDTSTATVNITVDPVDDLPVAVDDTATVNEDVVLNDTLVTNDTLSGDGGNVWAKATDPSNGTVVVNADGTYTYTPTANYNGPDSFTYTITDVDGDVSTATVNLTVDPVDDLPIAVDDTPTVNEDAVLNDTLVTNDTPSGDGGNVWAKVTDPSNGTVVVNADGTYTYTPNANYNGPDSFTYTITDVDGDVSTATATITVSPVDDLPIAVDDTAMVNEDVVLNDTLVTNDTLSGDGGNVWAKATDPTNGTVVVNADGTYSYTPNASYNGPDSFTYTITDVDGDVSTATVNLTVAPVDDVPVAVDDSPTVTEDAVLNDTLVTNDTPSPDGGNVWAKATDPSNGTVVVNADGTYVYTPNADYNGADSFTYTITDVDGDVSTATVNITVDPVDDVPVAVDDTAIVNEDAVLNDTVAGNDTLSGDGGNVFAKATDPSNGTVVVNADGTYAYTPNADYNGADSFTYTITDVDGDVSTATVNITVDPVDDVPVAVDDAATVNEDAVLNDTVAGNDTLSADGGNVFAKATDPVNGTVVVNADGTYAYTPNADYNGADSFTYTITDVDGDVSTATVNLTVDPVDDLPVAVDDTPMVNEDTVLNDTLVTNDTPSGDGGNVWAKATDPANGTVVVNADGTYTYTPNANYNGPDSFTYTITDVDGDVSTATATITVSPVDDLPIAVDDTATVNEDVVLNDTLVTNDTLSGDGGNVFAKATDPSNGTVTVNADGTYAYTPNADYNGADSFTYTITDVDGDVSTATVNITVDPVDDVPVAVDDTATVNEDAVLNDTVVGNDTLSADGGNVFAKATDPSNGTVVVNADGTYTYTPNADYNGADSFTYTITDVDGDSSTATVNLTVNPIGDVPVAVDDVDQTENTTSVTLAVLDNDSDPDGDLLTVSGTTSPSNGSVTVNGGSTITYTPNAGFIGTDTFEYTISDGNAGSDTATATVHVCGTQTIDWSNETWTPASTNNTYSVDSGGEQRDVTFDLSGINGVFYSGVSGTFPSIDDAGTGLFGGDDNLGIAFDPPDRNTSTVTLLITFDQAVDNLSFTIDDIDSSSPTGSTGRTDLVTVTGSDGSSSFGPDSFTAVSGSPTFSIIGSNMAQGSTTTDLDSDNDSNGSVLVTFDSPVTEITILYDEVASGTGNTNDPGPRGIAIGDLSWHLCPASIPPIVIDLDGDGVEFASVAEGIQFDVDGDGELEQTAWAGRDDAVLVFDGNENGLVDDRSEFAFADYGAEGATDLEGLQQGFDTDDDLMLTADDADYDKFKLWQDADGNGVVGDGELQSLSEAGVESIALESDGNSYSAANGDVLVHGEALVTYVDGTTTVAADAEFDYEEEPATTYYGEGPLEVVTSDGEVISLDAPVETPAAAPQTDVASAEPETEAAPAPVVDDSASVVAAAM